MAIEQGIWKLGDPPRKLRPSALPSESALEEQVVKDIGILNRNWLKGQSTSKQVRTEAHWTIPLNTSRL